MKRCPQFNRVETDDALTFCREVSNLWRTPLDGAPPTQITDFKSDSIRYFSYSRDGKHLALSRGNVTRDAVLIIEEK
jgi:hypothetical protein